MNKINPLYILGFFTLALILIIYKTSVMQEKISIVTQKNVQIEEDGKQIQLLKKRWKNQKLMTQRLKKILNHKSFAKKVTKKEKKRNIYSIKLENLDYRTLDSFTNKILNEAIIIKKMTIERFSENNASISLECSL
jgi:hypothetical protein